MTNAIANFFAAATSNDFAPTTACSILGVIAYAYGFFFPPEEFFAGDFASIAESAAVDAGVEEAEVIAWLEDNREAIESALAIIGPDHNRPLPSSPGDATWLQGNNLTAEQFARGYERRS